MMYIFLLARENFELPIPSSPSMKIGPNQWECWLPKQAMATGLVSMATGLVGFGYDLGYISNFHSSLTQKKCHVKFLADVRFFWRRAVFWGRAQPYRQDFRICESMSPGKDLHRTRLYFKRLVLGLIGAPKFDWPPTQMNHFPRILGVPDFEIHPDVTKWGLCWAKSRDIHPSWTHWKNVQHSV